MVVLEFALAVTALSTFSLASTYAEGQYTNSTSPGSSATGGESPTVGIETGTAESAASSTVTAHGGGISLGLYPTITVEICGKQCPCGGGHPSYPTETISVPYTVTVNKTATTTQTFRETITDNTTTTATATVVSTDLETTTNFDTATDIETRTTTTTNVNTTSATVYVPTTILSTAEATKTVPTTVIDEHTNFTTVVTTIVSKIPTSVPVSTTVTTTDVVTNATTDTVIVTKPPVTTTISGIATTVTPAPETLTTTLPGSATTLPGTTAVVSVISTAPPVTKTISQSGTAVTTVISGKTTVVTSTVTGPSITITQTSPPETRTVSTTVITSVTTCAVPTNNPGPPPSAFDPLSDLTWGCRPGSVCSPKKLNGCNVWADAPADDFLCHPLDCIPSPEFQPADWPENKTAYYPPNEGYFNLAPPAFGLSYDIFEQEVIVEVIDGKTTSVTTGNWASQSTITHYPPTSTTTTATTAATTASTANHSYPVNGGGYKRRDSASRSSFLSKRDDTVVPALCYDTCNNCYLEAQKVGKTPALCRSGSAFKDGYDACQQCIDKHSDDVKLATRQYLEPKFAQYINFCNAQSAKPGGTSSGPQFQQSSTGDVQTRSQDRPNTNTSPSAIPGTTTSHPRTSDGPGSSESSGPTGDRSSPTGGGGPSTTGSSTGSVPPGATTTAPPTETTGGNPTTGSGTTTFMTLPPNSANTPAGANLLHIILPFLAAIVFI